MELMYDNIKINYNILGENNKKVILFLHGWGGSIESFKLVGENLAQDYKCVLVDFPPFGKSEEPYRIWTIEDYSNAVLEIIRQHNLKNIAIVSHSFGGRVAIFLASNYNNLVSKLMLVDSAGIKPRFNLVKFLKVKKYKFCKKFGINCSYKGSADYQKLSLLMQKTFINIIGYNQKKSLSKVKAKTLIIWGEKDRETPLYMAKIMQKNIENSSLVVMKGFGHFCYLQNYYKFLSILKNFLKG